MFLFSTVRRKMHFFICLQCPSCLFVSYLSGLTNSIEWFTVLWMYPYLAKFEYAFQRSLTMVVPGSIHSWICFNKVFSLRSSTVTIKHFLESSSMPPKTHWPSTTCSRWYFFFLSWIHRYAQLFQVLQVSDGFQTASLRKVLDKTCPNPQQCDDVDQVTVWFATALILGSTSM